MIATFCISLSRGVLNDEKVGTVKIAGQENVSRVYPIFFCRIRNGVTRPRRIPKGNYGLVTTVGTTFYAITRLCFTAGALTHLLVADMRRVSFYYTRRHLFDNVVTDHYERPSCFSGREQNTSSSSILSVHCRKRTRRTPARKITDNERTNSCFVSHACGMHHPLGVNRN